MNTLYKVGMENILYMCIYFVYSWVAFGNIKLNLPIDPPKRKAVKVFLQNKTVLQRMNIHVQDTIVCEQTNWSLPSR